MNYGSAITFEDKIYLIGGRNSSNTYTKKVLIYEDSASGWREKSNLSGPARGNVTSLIFQNRIWVIGGSSANGYTNTVESYDLDSDYGLLRYHFLLVETLQFHSNIKGSFSLVEVSSLHRSAYRFFNIT